MIRRIIEQRIPPVTALEIIREVADLLFRRRIFNEEDRKEFVAKMVDNSVIVRGIEHVLDEIFSKEKEEKEEEE